MARVKDNDYAITLCDAGDSNGRWITTEHGHKVYVSGGESVSSALKRFSAKTFFTINNPNVKKCKKEDFKRELKQIREGGGAKNAKTHSSIKEYISGKDKEGNYFTRFEYNGLFGKKVWEDLTDDELRSVKQALFQTLKSLAETDNPSVMSEPYISENEGGSGIAKGEWSELGKMLTAKSDMEEEYKDMQAYNHYDNEFDRRQTLENQSNKIDALQAKIDRIKNEMNKNK